MNWPWNRKSREIRDAEKAIDHKMDVFRRMLKNPNQVNEAYLLARNIAHWKRWVKEKSKHDS